MVMLKGVVFFNVGFMVGFFCSIWRKLYVFRNCGFYYRFFLFVEEVQFIEEIVWSRQSISSKKEFEFVFKLDDLVGVEVIGFSRFCNFVDKSNWDLQCRLIIEDIFVVEFLLVLLYVIE